MNSSQKAPALSIISLGASVNQDRRIHVHSFLSYLKSIEVLPRFAASFDLTTIMQEGYKSYSPEPGQFDSRLYCNLEVDWQQPKDTIADLLIELWNNNMQICVRIDVFTLPSAHLTFSSLDTTAEHALVYATRIHQYLDAMLTVIDYLPMRSLSPYDINKMPLWVGWCSIYGDMLRENHGIDKITEEDIKGVNVAQFENTMVLRSPLSFSKYRKHGWNTDAQSFWNKVNGKFLRQSVLKNSS